MKRFDLAMVCLVLMFLVSVNNIYGKENTAFNIDTDIIQQIEEFKNAGNNLLKETTGVYQDSQLNVTNNLSNPFEIVVIFLKAFVFVIGINIIAKIFVKLFFDCSEVSKARKKSKELNKVLKELYGE